MTANKKRSQFLVRILSNLLQAYVKRISDLAQLARLEARLAGKTLVTLSLLMFVLIFLLATSYVSFLLFLFCCLLAWHLAPAWSALIIFFVNLFLLMMTYWYMVKIKSNLFFPATRRQLANITRKGAT